MAKCPVTETRVTFLKAGVHRVPYSHVGDHSHPEHTDTPMPRGLNCPNYYSVALNEWKPRWKRQGIYF